MFRKFIERPVLSTVQSLVEYRLCQSGTDCSSQGRWIEKTTQRQTGHTCGTING